MKVADELCGNCKYYRKHKMDESKCNSRMHIYDRRFRVGRTIIIPKQMTNDLAMKVVAPRFFFKITERVIPRNDAEDAKFIESTMQQQQVHDSRTISMHENGTTLVQTLTTHGAHTYVYVCVSMRYSYAVCVCVLLSSSASSPVPVALSRPPLIDLIVRLRRSCVCVDRPHER